MPQINVEENPNVTHISINTSQPQPLRGLKLKGVKKLKTVQIELADGRIIAVNRKDRKKFLKKHSGSKLIAAERVPVKEEKTEKKSKGKKKGAKRVKH